MPEKVEYKKGKKTGQVNWMHVFSQAEVIELMDGVACVLLAMAVSFRGRAMGGNLAGVLILGCVCSLSASLGREFMLHGSQGLRLVMANLPASAMIGSAAGLILAVMTGKHRVKIFFLLDTLSMTLMCALTATLAAPELGALGALALGVAIGLVPGLIRDVSLGDAAIFLEQAWYATGGIIASLCAVIVILLPAFWTMPGFFVMRLGEWAVLTGTVAGTALRYWHGQPMNNFI